MYNRLLTILLLCMQQIQTSTKTDQLKHRLFEISTTLSRQLPGWQLSTSQCLQTSSTISCHKITHMHSIPNNSNQEENAAQQENTNKKNIGLVMIVLNPYNGRTVFQKVFPIQKYWAHWIDIEWHLKQIESGQIVVLTNSMTSTVGLRNTKQLLIKLGSTEVAKLRKNDQWTWIFYKGGRTIMEVVSSSIKVHIHASTYLSLPEQPNLNWSKKRKEYCNCNGIMGGLCDTSNPDQWPMNPAPSLPVNFQKVLENIPVIVTAGNRPQYLYYTLKTLLSTPGVKSSNILVLLGDTSQKTTEMLDILHVQYNKISMKGVWNQRLFNYYRQVFHFFVDHFSNSSAVIILDEDVEVSQDFFSYFSQTLHLLEQDPSLYCINGMAFMGEDLLAYNVSTIFRGQVQVSWGYAITTDFVKESLVIWDELSDNWEAQYDFWLFNKISRGRECVYPEVSRSRHFGIGLNTDAQGSFMEKHYLMMPIVTKSPVILNTKIKSDEWHKFITDKIRTARPLMGSPCNATFLPSPLTGDYTFYYSLNGTGSNMDISTYYYIALCIGFGTFGEQGHTDGVHIFRISANNSLFTIGVPYSSYSHMKPANVPLWSRNYLTNDDLYDIYVNKLDRS